MSYLLTPSFHIIKLKHNMSTIFCYQAASVSFPLCIATINDSLPNVMFIWFSWQLYRHIANIDHNQTTYYCNSTETPSSTPRTIPPHIHYHCLGVKKDKVTICTCTRLWFRIFLFRVMFWDMWVLDVVASKNVEVVSEGNVVGFGWLLWALWI